MIEKIMKIVKSSNKKRSRNITIGVVIGLLLSCTAVMGTGTYLWIKEDGGEIKFSTDSTTGTDGNWKAENPYEGITWNADTKTYTNNMVLLSNAANGKGTYKNKDVDISYGLRLNGNLTDMNFVNNGSIIGIISGSSSSYSYGSGIYNLGIIGDITSTGVISGNNGGRGYGSGIYNLGTIGAITNTGVISGNGSNGGYGSGIYNSGTIGAITNIGVISGNGNDNGGSGGSGVDERGIYNNSATVGNITNTGIISGYIYANSRGNSYGINNYESVEIKNITNTGTISGSGYSIGNGIVNDEKSRIGNIINTGIISGYGCGYSIRPSYGIANYTDSRIGNIINTGIISSSCSCDRFSASVGIANYANSTVENIINTGIISGASIAGTGIVNVISGTIRDITNTGVIYGKDNAIRTYDGTITTASNYGILVNGDGGKGVVDGLEIKTSARENKLVNYGLIIKNGSEIVDKESVQDEVKAKIEEYNDDGTAKSAREMTIKNKKITDGSKSFTGNEKDSILNALTNTYKVTGSNDEIIGSIINAYKTAVVFGEADKKLTLSGTIVNGGIDGSAAISGSGGEDTLILQSGKVEYIDGSEATQNTIVNGNIDMGDGADKLIVRSGTVLNGDVAMGTGNDKLDIEKGAVINGKLDGGEGDNILNFRVSGAKSYSPENEGIRILHNISNFKNMNINTNVTLFEKTIGAEGEETDLKVSGVEEINIKAGGVLNLRIDSRTSTNGRYVGHALFGNIELKINGDISQLPGGKTEIKETEGEKCKVGVFNLITNGLGIDAIIAMDGITLNKNLFVKTNSILDRAVILKEPEENGKVGDIKIKDNKDIFVINKEIPRDEQKYIKLNEIYKGIHSSARENFNALKDILTLNGAGEDYTSVTDKEQLAILLSYLNNIYTGTPYSYSSELSRKSAGMFRDIVTENQFKPEQNKWLIMGGLTHRDGGTKDTYYGKNYHGFDTGTADVDVDMKLTGAYALGKYGYSEKVSLGVTVGGNRGEAKLPMSKVKGNSGYIGAFAENYRGNLTLKAGAGIQYSEYDADRGTLRGHSYSDKYSDMTYDIYLNGRYSIPMGDNFFLEPYGTLSYTYVDQDGANEGSKTLAIETDSKSFDYTAAKVGVDLKKVIPHEKGKSTLSAGVSYTRLLTGADEENITGRFKGGNATDFDILVAHKNEHSIGLNAKYALELESGILFDVKGSYSVERDSHNGSGKNRNKGEWIVGAGIGYKF